MNGFLVENAFRESLYFSIYLKNIFQNLVDGKRLRKGLPVRWSEDTKQFKNVRYDYGVIGYLADARKLYAKRTCCVERKNNDGTARIQKITRLNRIARVYRRTEDVLRRILLKRRQ